ncbi:MAG: M23 family metallopeptidase [Spirochaetia bacterium]|nr:M23 family metallopeptidase [Spirochaetia bacterium]
MANTDKTSSAYNKRKSGKKNKTQDVSVLAGAYLNPPAPESFLERLKINIKDLLVRIQKKGRERLTIMIIPHTEKKILNLHMSMYTITGVVVSITVIMMVSIMSLVGKSGEDIEFYDMGLTNSQFNLQSIKMAEEMFPIHDLINRYTNTIAELYARLDGRGSENFAQGGAAQAIINEEMDHLRSLVEECRSLGEDCSQEQTEEILRRITYLSKQDNQSLEKAIELSEKIIEELNTKEKQNLLKNTPSIWPVRGYILSPYGEQVDQVLGKKVFNRGIEIGAFQGSEVYVSAPGEVVEVNYDPTYGLSVWVKHKYGIRTFYSRLGSIKVSLGEKINKGHVIGTVGRTGDYSIPALYYEVHVGTVSYNPHAFLNHLQDEWLIQPKL